ncbi:MAG: cation-transporting P-type ATPase, partial [Thermomicrobiales bacterium]
MSATAAVLPAEILHALPGRVRVSLPNWSGQGRRDIEDRLAAEPGVRRVRANPVTGNVLIQFDPRARRQEQILAAVRALAPQPGTGIPIPITLDTPPAVGERAGDVRRARIAVRGLDRDPELARRVEMYLAQRPGVKLVRAAPLTGRVLVEFDAAQVSQTELLRDVSDLELPLDATEDRPLHPLERGPLLRHFTRVTGAALGFALLTARGALGIAGPLAGSSGGAERAAIVGVTLNMPAVRAGLRHLLGKNAADVLIAATGSVTLALSGNRVGMGLAALEGALSGTAAFNKRASWQRHEEVEAQTTPARPGDVVRFEAEDRAPRAAAILAGAGTAIGADGLPVALAPGRIAPAGARLFGGPFSAELLAGEAFDPLTRAVAPRETLMNRYLKANGIASLGYAALMAVLTRSPQRALATVLLFNPRTAVTGAESAESAAWSRVIRGGATYVGTRPARKLTRPDLLLLSSPRLLTDGLEVASVLPLSDAYTTEDIERRAAALSLAAGSPWGRVFANAAVTVLADGAFDGETAGGTFGDVRYTLGPVTTEQGWAGVEHLRERGEYVLLLRREDDTWPVGVIGLRPKLAPDVEALAEACAAHDIELGLVAGDSPHAAEAIIRRTGAAIHTFEAALPAITAVQERGGLVAVVADSVEAAAAFDLADLAVGLTDGRSEFPARADLLAPDLTAVAEVVAATTRRDTSVRNSVILAAIANLAGAAWGLHRRPGLLKASNILYATALISLADSWLRQRGGERPQWATARFVDPRPERWGRRDIESVLRALNTAETGLTSEEAASRVAPAALESKRDPLWKPVLDELTSPLTGILLAGGLVSLATGRFLDVVMIGGVIAANVSMGVWQNGMATRAADTVAELGIPTARVLRDGQPTTISATEVVPGDILLIAAGDRVAADARMLTSQGIEVDDAALTGESLPVAKGPDAASEADRIILDGSDVVAGTGRAIVVAVGPKTRMGATAAAMTMEREGTSPLDFHLNRILKLAIPTSVATG